MSDENPYAPDKTIKEEIAEDLRQVGESHGPKLTIKEYIKYGEHSPNRIYKNFDSFSNAVRKAGMFPVKAFNKQDLIRAINKLGEKLDRPPMPEEMNKNGLYDASCVKSKFGGYRTALSEAGYNEKEIETYWQQEHVSESIPNSASSNQDTSKAIDDDKGRANDDSDSGDKGIIDKIMSDFDEI